VTLTYHEIMNTSLASLSDASRVWKKMGDKFPYHRDGRLVGYATLTGKAKPSRASGTYLRRVFWLAPHDRDQDPDGLYATGAPSEAVDPRTLKPTIKGYKTERSEGRPASDAMREMGIELPKV